MQQKLYFIPVYIGSLKYYAKLLPFLAGKYEAAFLIIRGDDERRKAMVSYCEDNSLAFEVLDAGLRKSAFRVPFLTVLLKRLAHRRACRNFLIRNRPSKIIVTKISYPHRAIVEEANRLDIETILLQWAFLPSTNIFNERGVTRALIARAYYRLIDFLIGLLRITELHVPKKIGVIDDEGKKALVARHGFHAEDIAIVGMADFQIARELKEKIRSDEVFRRTLREKYGIPEGKRVITVLAQAHHLKKSAKTTLEEQLDHYRKVLEPIRVLFPVKEAAIMLKLHPSDDKKFYAPYQDLHVILCGDEASTEELVCLSDLVITDPWTTANFIVLASGVPALFVNFSKFQSLNRAISYYRVKESISKMEAYKNALEAYKQGRLSSQYDNSHIPAHSIDVIAKWIG
jgi:hypothetical protein